LNRQLTPPFRSGPWTAPEAPALAEHVDGVPIVERLATRDDASGAVVRLRNGRLAVLGETFAVGRPRLLLDLFAGRRGAAAQTDGDRAWWSEVAQVLRGSQDVHTSLRAR
jgi:hypothetical protein